MSFLNKSVLLLALGLVSPHLASATVLNATSLTMKVFKFAVSTSVTCSNPVVIFSSVAGVSKDLLSSPTFGSGPLAAGTYPCVMIEASKVVDISPTGGAQCTAAFTDVICNDSGQTSTLLDGTTTTCSGGSANDQHVVLYLNTNQAVSNCGNDCFLPPTSTTDTTHGIKLTNAFVVTADAAGTLSMTKNFISDSSPCSTNAPTFSFQ